MARPVLGSISTFPGPYATTKDTSNPTTSTKLPNHMMTSFAINPMPALPL